MPTASHIVDSYVKEHPYLLQAMERGLINYAALAEEIHGLVEEELGKKVKLPAIMMALRRAVHALKAQEYNENYQKLAKEIILKTHLIDISVRRSPKIYSALRKITELADYEKGEVLNVIYGTYELSIVTNQKYKEEVLKLLYPEKVLGVHENLVAVSIIFDEAYFYSPGIIAAVTRTLAWENVNVLEIVTTRTELAIVVAKKDALKAYRSLQDLLSIRRPSHT